MSIFVLFIQARSIQKKNEGCWRNSVACLLHKSHSQISGLPSSPLLSSTSSSPNQTCKRFDRMVKKGIKWIFWPEKILNLDTSAKSAEIAWFWTYTTPEEGDDWSTRWRSFIVFPSDSPRSLSSRIPRDCCFHCHREPSCVGIVVLKGWLFPSEKWPLFIAATSTTRRRRCKDNGLTHHHLQHHRHHHLHHRRQLTMSLVWFFEGSALSFVVAENLWWRDSLVGGVIYGHEGTSVSFSNL